MKERRKDKFQVSTVSCGSTRTPINDLGGISRLWSQIILLNNEVHAKSTGLHLGRDQSLTLEACDFPCSPLPGASPLQWYNSPVPWHHELNSFPPFYEPHILRIALRAQRTDLPIVENGHRAEQLYSLRSDSLVWHPYVTAMSQFGLGHRLY